MYCFNGVVLLFLVVGLTGCGTLTGLPGHGGGKRFAVEQELVSAATRGAVKQIDLSALHGKKINLFVNAIGDAGAGNLVGGRYSVISQLRGDYIQAPPTIERSVFPRYTTSTNSSSSTNSSETTTSGSSASSERSDRSYTSGTSTTESTLASPERKTTKQEGDGVAAQLGVEYKGIGAYHNSEEIPSNDLQYLSAIMQTYFFLRGVYVVPPSEAEVDVYVTVDVFGTVRSRVEWFLANNEILKAKTVLEILAVDHLSGKVIIPPQSAGAESEYNEQYILWAGPVSIKETLTKAKPLLSSFCDMGEKTEDVQIESEKDIEIEYPFHNQLGKLGRSW